MRLGVVPLVVQPMLLFYDNSETLTQSKELRNYQKVSTLRGSTIWPHETWVVVPLVVQPIMLFYNNSKTLTQSKELGNHRKSKHIKRKYHLIS